METHFMCQSCITTVIEEGNKEDIPQQVWQGKERDKYQALEQVYFPIVLIKSLFSLFKQ